jgi:hypothetical protein
MYLALWSLYKKALNPAFLFLTALSNGYSAENYVPAEVQRIVDIREKEIRKINEQYLSALERQKKRYIRRGEFDDAALVDNLIKERHKDILGESDWSTPFGGNVVNDGDLVSLRGPGTTAANGAIAILDADLDGDYTIEGECRIDGRYGGFVFGYEPKDNTFVSIYSRGRDGTDIFSHNGKRRFNLGRHKFHWPVNAWKPFRISKREQKVEIQIGDDTFGVDLPNDRIGPHFGLVAYRADSMVSLRRVKVTRSQH